MFVAVLVCMCSNTGERVGPGETPNTAVSLSMQGDRTTGDGQDSLSSGLCGPQWGMTPTTVLWENGNLSASFSSSHSFCLLQTKGNSSSAFSPYAINTVQVSNQEKYLIVSSFLILTLNPWSLTLTKPWPLNSALPCAAQWGWRGGRVPEDIRRFLWRCLSHVRHQWPSLLRLLCQYLQGQPVSCFTSVCIDLWF